MSIFSQVRPNGLPCAEPHQNGCSFPSFDPLDPGSQIDSMTRAAVITDTPPETLAQRNPSVIRSLIDQLWSHCLQIQEREEPHQSKQQIPTNSLLSGEELLLPAVITLLHAEAIARSPRGAVDKTSSHSARGEEYPIKNHITSQLEQIIDPSEPIPHSRYVSTGLSTEGKHIFVIPDIHGNYDLLRESLDYIGQQLHAQEIDPNGAVLVQLGDLINKGPDSGAVLGLMDALKRAASVSSSSPGEAAQKTSNFNHLVDELGLAGFGEVALLIGNHEDAGNIGMHLTSDAPIDDYARDTSHALHRYGLRETILSIITDFPDAFENEDARWLAAAVDSFPVRIGKEDGWYWSKDGSEQAEGVPTQRDVEDFFQTFRNIWVPGLEESGLLGVAASLKPAHRVGDFIFTHAGPPKDAHQMSSLLHHLTPNSNTALSQHTLDHILNDHSVSDEKLLHHITTAIQAEPESPLLPAGFVFGHTPGGCFEHDQSSAPLLAIGLDLGVGSSGLALPVLHINPEGEATMLVALRRHHGIVPVALNPATFLPPAGHRGLPARAPI